MPGKTTKKKELYLGKCLGDLHKLSEIKQLGNNVNIIIRSASKVFQDAENLDVQGDEERAYVMYHKYFNILQQIKPKADYKKQKAYYDNLIGTKNQLKAIERAEHLAESLKERYDLRDAEAVAKKLASVDAKPPTEKPSDKTDVTEKPKTTPEDKLPDVVTPTQPAGAIKCTNLCDLLRDNNTKLILMDVRPEADFLQSHISHTECISVPEEIITPGSTVNPIESKLPVESKAAWQQRKHADHIVLIDWKSTLHNVVVGTPLRTLKDALFKFDMQTIIKSEPLILEGGYEQWLLFYPTMTTNAHVSRPSDASQEQPPSPTMTLDFDYPDLDENVQKAIVKESGGQMQTLNQGNLPVTLPAAGDLPLSMPRFDRSLKPSKPSDSSLSSSASTEGMSSGLNNAQPQSSFNADSSTSASALYPNVSASIMSNKSTTEKNINVLNDRSTSGPKSINLSVKNNLASDLSQSVEKREEKEIELKNFQQSRDVAMRKDEQRVEEAERRLRDLEQMKKKEEKDVADLMRMKRKLKEELEEEKRRQGMEREKFAAEEEKRLLAVEDAKREEEEKRKRMQEIERLRQDRKREEQHKELAQRKQEEEEKIAREAEEKAKHQKLDEERRELDRIKEAEKMKLEEEQRLQRRLDEEKRKEEDEKLQIRLENEKKEVEEAKRKEEERKEMIRKEEEQKEMIKREEQRRQKEQAEREKERKRQEEIERKRAEEAAAQENARREREAAEKLKRMKVTEQPASKKVPSNLLPAGWEKRLDRATNRYFYIDHNHGTTQWIPPAVPASAEPPDTYTTKLKDEPSVTSSRGMTRAHSSPNIKKQLEEEEARSRKPAPVPSIDRANKPSPVKVMPRQTAYVVRKRDLNPVYGNVGPGLTGLRNLGNTCYMNSTVQCLSNTSPLISYFLRDSYLQDINRESSQGMHGEVVDDFAVVIKALWSQQYRSITPRDLKSTVAKYNPMFAGYQQQDSQEFLTFLLDGLHEGLNEVKVTPDIPEQNNDNLADRDAAQLAWKHHKLLHKSIIVELFQGQLKSTLMCRTCKKKSVTFQAFMFLSLPIPASSRCSLKDCISEFLKPEMMTGSSKWKCPRCKVERDSEKKIDIWKLPPILLVGLNRFYSEGMWMQKKTTYVDFPLTDLDFSSHMIGPPPRSRYNLYGISNHYGTMEGGHYTAFCRNAVTKKWYKFDDQDVYEMSQSDVKTSAAFVLYYTSIEMPAPKYLPHL